VLCITVLTLTYATARLLGAHVVTFIFYSMLIASVTLIAITGWGKDARAMMLAPSSWIVGAGIIAMEASYFVLLADIPPGEASLMIRVSIPLSVLVGTLFFRRRLPRSAWLGGLLVALAVAPLFAQLRFPEHWSALAASLCCALFVNVRTYAAEFHPWNREARTVLEKMRVTGIVVLITALGGLALIGIAVALTGAGLLPATPLVPQPAQLVHGPTLLMALLTGIVLFTALSYFIFSSVIKIGSENLIAVTAFMPLTTLIAQLIVTAAGLLHFPPFDWRLVPLFVLAIVGVFIMIRGNRRE
jgi:drug/metabolite transporter (DMT)-like permease